MVQFVLMVDLYIQLNLKHFVLNLKNQSIFLVEINLQMLIYVYVLAVVVVLHKFMLFDKQQQNHLLLIIKNLLMKQQKNKYVIYSYNMIEHYLLLIHDDVNQKNLVVLVHVPNTKNHTVNHMDGLVLLFAFCLFFSNERT